MILNIVLYRIIKYSVFKIGTLLGFLFFVSMDFASSQDLNNHVRIGGRFQISFEQQSYLETGKRIISGNNQFDTMLVDIEKSAGICSVWGVEIFTEFKISKNMAFESSLGLKSSNQEYYYSEILATKLDYLEMGISNVKSQYLTVSFGFRYNKPRTQKFYLIPRVNFESDLLIEKSEFLEPLKYTFSIIESPYFTFRSVIPKVSLGLELCYSPSKSDYGFSFGFVLSNNPRYVFEKIGILSFPLSFSLSISISKIY